jgi:hypothetical protein
MRAFAVAGAAHRRAVAVSRWADREGRMLTLLRRYVAIEHNNATRRVKGRGFGKIRIRSDPCQDFLSIAFHVIDRLFCPSFL